MKPNILHIFTDQQRFDTIHALGNSIIKTPNIDRLVKMGVSYTNAYTPSPVCVAARCSMIYGQYPLNTECWSNDKMPTDDRKSFMQVLKEDNYRVHGIGKCHFTPDAFEMRGFETREYQEELPFDKLEKEPYQKFLCDNGYSYACESFGVRGEMYYIPQPSRLPEEYHPTQWIGDRSVEFIKSQSGDKPWYLFSSFVHPHPPFSPPAPWHKIYRAPLMPLPNVPDDLEGMQILINKLQNRYKYRDAGLDNNLIRCMKAYYYACISFVDSQVGRLLDSLEETGQMDNTLILFTTDHGELLGDYNSFGKRSMHDSAARIPFIIYQKGRFEGGEICDAPVSLVDVAPTLLRAAQLKIDSHKVDGVDIKELKDGTIDREGVYSFFSAMGEARLAGLDIPEEYTSDFKKFRALMANMMYATKDKKYIYSMPDRKEIYIDKIYDPNETRNRAGMRIVDKDYLYMKQKLISFIKDNGGEEFIENDDFRRYTVVEMTKIKDRGLLLQDINPPWFNSKIKGYLD